MPSVTRSEPSRPLDILILGGTGFLGPHLVEDALSRGHRVTLAEASDKLGGQFRLAGLQPRRAQITDFLDWLEGQLQRLQVEVRRNTYLDTDEIAAMDYDTVILATGSSPTEAPTQQQLPLLYSALEPLSSSVHGKMKIKTVEKAPVIATVHAIPATVDEFPLLARHYPIIFAVGDTPVPLALMGLSEGVNAYMDENGRAIEPDIYIPAYIRRYPFLLARLRPDSDELSLCFDPTIGAVGEFDEGEPLFEEGGEPSKATARSVRSNVGSSRGASKAPRTTRSGRVSGAVPTSSAASRTSRTTSSTSADLRPREAAQSSRNRNRVCAKVPLANARTLAGRTA